jgi:purine-nucleoside phosphorylase
MTEAQKIDEAREFLRPRLKLSPSIAVVLGSGLASVAESLTHRQSIPYSEIPHWPAVGVSGHAGELIGGHLAQTPLLVLSGRVHLYQGCPPSETVFGVRVLAALGIQTLILSNAAGGIREGFEPGALVLVSDHINLQFASPLSGLPIDANLSRFVDLTAAYDRGLQEIAQQAAAKLSLELKQGVYAAVIGPQYETPAEIRLLRTIGADMAGMSTVMETIAARQLGMKVLAFSVIANRAAGLSGQLLSHQEVLEVSARASSRLTSLLRVMVPEVG